MQETVIMWWHWLPPQGCWYKNFFFLFLFWVAICLILNSGENKYISHIPVQLKACLSTHTEQCSTRRLTVNKESSYFPLFLTMFSKKNHYKRWESCCSVFTMPDLYFSTSNWYWQVKSSTPDRQCSEKNKQRNHLGSYSMLPPICWKFTFVFCLVGWLEILKKLLNTYCKGSIIINWYGSSFYHLAQYLSAFPWMCLRICWCQ